MANLQWNYDNVTTTIPIPPATYLHAEMQRSTFLAVLEAEASEPKLAVSELELVSRFILHVANAEPSEIRDELLDHVWRYIQVQLLSNGDIHEMMCEPGIDPPMSRRIMRAYTAARMVFLGKEWQSKSALFHAQTEAQVQLYGIFGGQGNTRRYFDELRGVCESYNPFVHDFVRLCGTLLQDLVTSVHAPEQYPHGIRVLQWLEHPDCEPSADYLLSAPVSFPLIGLLQLMQYKSMCMSLGMTPGAFNQRLRGLAGHSQGVVVAAAISTSRTWLDFDSASVTALKILFSIGLRSQQVFNQSPLLLIHSQKLQSNGHGTPSPMLSVSNIAEEELRNALADVNNRSRPDCYAYLSLVNTASSYVVSGSERTLASLVHALRATSSTAVRSTTASTRFLPITVPCHCPLLDAAVPLIDADLRRIVLPAHTLGLAVAGVNGGTSGGKVNVVPMLVRMITSQPVHWTSVVFEGATHVIDFGPGAMGGIGRVTSENLLGSGARVIVAGKLEVDDTDELGTLSEAFQSNPDVITWAPDWDRQHRPSIFDSRPKPIIATKLSQLLKLPPVFVAGMTPTTTHPDFVAAIMKAGYHAEFATGGYHDAESLRMALTQLRDMMPIGRTITVNVIYASPKALSWQIPLLAQLRAGGMPITGLTVGGGVPSLDVASGYITTMGLEHISFKPSSAEAIYRVIDIAKANPSFPIILQWTGGRGGGHHSSADFHAPILETYAAVRRCSNLIFVAGSGFGCAEDVLPYFTGRWSLEHGKAFPMPMDGILLGSRVMTCAEAHTSYGTKQAVAAAKGVDDKDWTGTYNAPTGGVISVISEMGEPIHVIATRGAQLWLELDRTIFSLDRKKRLNALQARKGYIISRLNADYQRPWFGRKPDGTPCEISEMTYIELLKRLVELTHVDGWSDPSYERLTSDFVARAEARLSTNAPKLFWLEDIQKTPQDVLYKLVEAVPRIAEALIHPEDAHLFVQLCRSPGTKPVPFIPVMDDKFETWFKKDSLWQSENLETVVEQDAGRTFILHGPVAARHTEALDEPVADVLDGIHQGVLEHITVRSQPAEESLLTSGAIVGALTLPNVWEYIVPTSDSHLLSALRSPRFSWATALLGVNTILRNRDRMANPWRKLLADATIAKVEILGEAVVLHTGQLDASTIELSKHGNRVRVSVETSVTSSREPSKFVFEFDYLPNTPYAPIREIMDGRNQRLCETYRRLWSCQDSAPLAKAGVAGTMLMEHQFFVEDSHVQSFNQATGYQGLRGPKTVTLDFAMVASWGAIAPLLLQQPRDILSLVHLSNSYRVHDHSKALEVGDKLQARAQVAAITPRDAGLQVDIACDLWQVKTNTAVVSIRSGFLFRDTFCDALDTFKHDVVGPYEVDVSSPSSLAILDSKPWFRLLDGNRLGDLALTDITLRFDLQQHHVRRRARTWGQVYAKSDLQTFEAIGTVEYTTDDVRENSVLSYLSRHARNLSERPASTPAPLQGQETVVHTSELQVPASNEAYSRASGDYNPIHTSPVLAHVAGLPGPITHGMYCSAVVRQVLERHICGQHSERIRRYEVNFVGMVLPKSTLEVRVRFAGMKAGCGEYSIEVRDVAEGGGRVLTGSATIAQPSTTMVFTGQGSQEQGMGMDLYASSAAARAIWDRADAYFRSHFGLSLLDIVRNNPKEVTVYFAGARGHQLRRNYQSMRYELPSLTRDGKPEVKQMFPTINDRSASFTHASPKGLLFATQFAQPALAVMETAAFRDLQLAGVVDPDFCFTGHSLGEYAALSCSTGFLPLDRMLYLFYCRGLTMQSAVERDKHERSSYSMVAVDPSRIAKAFEETCLRKLIAHIETRTGFFIELVNFNVRNKQYVCAGDLRALELLQKTCDRLRRSTSAGLDVEKQLDQLPHCGDVSRYVNIAAVDVSLKRGLATVPLAGIDVPFHSTYLRPRMEAFRRVLLDSLDTQRLVPEELVGKYIPNVTGTLFRIDREYFNEAWEATGSEKLANVLSNWRQWAGKVKAEKAVMASA